MNAPTRIVQPGEIEAPAEDIPFLRLPDAATVFARRGERFRDLAQGHALGGFLALLGDLATAQQELLDHYPDVSLPDNAALHLARQHGLPPLNVQGWQRDPAWRDGFFRLLEKLRPSAMPNLKPLLDELAKLDGGRLEQAASQLLTGQYEGLDARLTPFLAAALQTYWVKMATALGEQSFDRIESPSLCPVCGTGPVASVVRGTGDTTGLRYLHCSLCATEWHMVRVKCSGCESTEGIAYYEVENGNGAVKAESCDSCQSYLKILYLAQDTAMEPFADDCATLALDLLMDESGKHRSGPNLYLHPGSL